MINLILVRSEKIYGPVEGERAWQIQENYELYTVFTELDTDVNAEVC
jgi:hypothetical protein